MEQKFIKRKVYDRIKKELRNERYFLITGARQVGKTAILKQLESELNRRKLPVYFVQLADSDVLDSLNEDKDNLFNYIPEPDDKPIFVLMDNIHKLEHSIEFIKYFQTELGEQLKMIFTTSLKFYADDPEFTAMLDIYPVHPLDLEEFLLFKDAQNLVKEWFYIRTQKDHKSYRRKKLEKAFHEYLTYGGFPEVVLTEDNTEKEEVLKNIATTFVKEDIYEAHIQNTDKLYKLFNLLAYKTGDLVNMSELSVSLQLSITAVENYLGILERNFHISMVQPFYALIKKELKKMPKIYYNDLGLRNMMVKTFLPVNDRLDRGQLVENYVHSRLRMLYNEDEILYWRTADGNEVDFVMPDAEYKGRAIEVKFFAKEYRPSKYKKFSKTYIDMPIEVRAFHADQNDQSILGL
ncbi:MAG: ATP-binding protein [Bacteroidales bacterium]|nr:ATP-binding protein [Bacteroidales bacterium]